MTLLARIAAIAAKVGTALLWIGAVYWFGLVGLIVSSSPGGAGQGPAAWDGYVPAIPGLQWFIHAAKATAIIFAGAIMNGWAQKKKTDQAKER
jgi:hypothetical protein